MPALLFFSMPLNEAKSFSRSNLTKEQQREAEAAIYGLRASSSMDLTQQLTPEEIERMRAILAAHDQTQTGKVNEFDLNNPPKVPYTYQAFPKMIYHHGAGKSKVVHHERELAAHLAAGWRKDQAPPPPPESELVWQAPLDSGPELDAETLAEAAALDKQAKTRKAR